MEMSYYIISQYYNILLLFLLLIKIYNKSNIIINYILYSHKGLDYILINYKIYYSRVVSTVPYNHIYNDK